MLPLQLVAQKQDRIWLFPDSAGIDFNDLNNPVAIHCNLVPPDVVSTSIADNSGNLLFYTGGVKTIMETCCFTRVELVLTLSQCEFLIAMDH